MNSTGGPAWCSPLHQRTKGPNEYQDGRLTRRLSPLLGNCLMCKGERVGRLSPSSQHGQRAFAANRATTVVLVAASVAAPTHASPKRERARAASPAATPIPECDRQADWDRSRPN